MTVKYSRSGIDWFPADDKVLDLHDKLPPNNYIVKATMFGQLYLEEVGSFEIPKKLYGDIDARADRILNTFQDRSLSRKGTGVLLAGEKGAGKTLLAKVLSVKAAATGMPTILINSPWHGEAFNKLVQDIEQPAILLFDEFEKVYGDRGASEKAVKVKADGEQDGPASQQDLLTLMDGVFPTPKLFLLTCNRKFQVDSRMLNRPGRLYYSLDYTGLSRDMVREYCQDTMLNQAHINEMLGVTCMFKSLSFDMLQAIVEECNRYGESPNKAMEMLNVKPEEDVSGQYQVVLAKDGKRLDVGDQYGGFGEDAESPPGLVQVAPFQQFHVFYRLGKTGKSSQRQVAMFSPDHMVKADAMSGTYRYKSGGFELVLTKHVAKPTPWERMFAA